MKRTIALVLAIMLGLTFLAGCGGGDNGGGGSNSPTPAPTSAPTSAPTPASTPAPTSAPTPAPPPEPKGPEMVTVTIENADYGDISFSYLDDGSFTVETAGPGSESLKELEDAYKEAMGTFITATGLTKAHLAGDGFHIVFGYIDYTSGNSKTFSSFNKSRECEDVELGSYKGFMDYYNKCFYLAFPATTQYAGRGVIIYPENLAAMDGKRLSGWAELLDLPGVAAVLETLEFSGTLKQEERWETLPVENDYIAFAPVEGWEFSEISPSSYTLINEGLPGSASHVSPTVRINTSSNKTPMNEFDETLNVTNSGKAEKIGDVTINGRRYLAAKDETINVVYLITSSGSYDLNENGFVKILVRYTVDHDLGPAMPLLETITFKE